MYERFGRIIYYIIWPLLAVYEPLTHRTRVIVRCDNDVLLVKGWLSDGKWQLPGGGVRWSERPEQAAARELYEETGVTVSAIDLRLVHSGRVQQYPGYQYSLYVTDIAAKPFMRLRSEEIIGAVWMPLDDAVTNPQVDTANAMLLRQLD